VALIAGRVRKFLNTSDEIILTRDPSPNFVVARKVGWGKIWFAAFDGPTPKTPIDAKISQIFLT